MGTSRSPAEFSRKITNLATVTQRRSKEIVGQGALTTKEIILAEAAARGVTPASRIAGRKWSVGYDVKGFNNPAALVRIRGPFHLVEGDTKPHFITSKKVGGSRASRGRRSQAAALVGTFGLSASGAFGRRGALRFSDGKYFTYSRHPGTKGKGIFRSAKQKAGVAVPLVMSQRVVGGWRSALK